jgi:hypothetical protein
MIPRIRNRLPTLALVWAAFATAACADESREPAEAEDRDAAIMLAPPAFEPDQEPRGEESEGDEHREGEEGGEYIARDSTWDATQRGARLTLSYSEDSDRFVGTEDFVRIDKVACLDFAARCKEVGVEHFALLGSVGANAHSRSFYLRTKGELEDGLRALDFKRLSLFRPSMILTPTNRYGLAQAITLAIWPRLNPILIGGLRKYRGIGVDRLGTAIARSVATPGHGVETLTWDAIGARAEPM